MNSFEGLWESFIVSGEASEACDPGKGTFHDTSAGQEHEAPFCHGVLDHFEPYALLLCGIGGIWAGIALVDLGQLHRSAGDLLALAPRPLACNRLHIRHQCLENTSIQPATKLLIHRSPRRQIARNHAPRAATASHIPHRVEHVP